MDHWDEVRSAYHVVRSGTVSGAAAALGVHHATVIRHIDALEERLGTKLFQRHARGYVATEAGEDLARVAQTTEDQFALLEGRLRGQGEGVTGELIVTALPSLGPLLVPVMAELQAAHPGLVVRYLSSGRLFRLSYGEAHVAIRAGSATQEPDNIVQPLASLPIGLFGSTDYLARAGRPESEADLAGHRFAVFDDIPGRAVSQRWLFERVPASAAVFRASEDGAIAQAIRSGAGLGFLPRWWAAQCPELIEVLPAAADWAAPLWLVSHVDLHRTPKVQACLAALKEAAKGWR